MKALLFVLAVSIPVGSLTAADWPGWLGPNRNGISEERLPAIESLREVWRAKVGIGYSGFAIGSGKVITLGHDRVSKETVYCFDEQTGRVTWTHSYPAKRMNNLHPGGPNATALIAGERVFTVSKDGQALCLSLRDGQVIWKRSLPEAMEDEVPTWGFGCSPVLEDGQLLFVSGRTIALDPDTGETIWKSEHPYKAGYSTVAVAGSESAPVLVAVDGAGVSLLKAKTGEEIARQSLRTTHNTIAATPVVLSPAGDSVFVATNVHSMRLTLNGTVLKPEWDTREMRNNISNSILLDGYLYGMDGRQKQSSCRLVCLRPSDGEVVWATGRYTHGSMTLAGDVFWMILETGELVSFAAESEAYRELGRRRIFNDRSYCWTHPAVANGRLFLRNAAGAVVCLGK